VSCDRKLGGVNCFEFDAVGTAARVCGVQYEIKAVAGFCPLKDLIKALADNVPGVAE
jgi:hypothetical protein